VLDVSTRTDTPRRGGRIRSSDAHRAVLIAAAELLDEVGYQGVTIEKIAGRSRVAKSTIYRWWRSKPELVMEAYTGALASRMPEPDTGTLAEDLTVFVAELYSVVNDPLRVRALRGLMAEAQLDPDFRGPFREWLSSRREIPARILRCGIERGELAADIDLDHAIDSIFGLFWCRLLVELAPLGPADAPGHVARLLHGFANDAVEGRHTSP
jgi:AcrR family transcriptional regulator